MVLSKNKTNSFVITVSELKKVKRLFSFLLLGYHVVPALFKIIHQKIYPKTCPHINLNWSEKCIRKC